MTFATARALPALLIAATVTWGSPSGPRLATEAPQEGTPEEDPIRIEFEPGEPTSLGTLLRVYQAHAGRLVCTDPLLREDGRATFVGTLVVERERLDEVFDQLLEAFGCCLVDRDSYVMVHRRPLPSTPSFVRPDQLGDDLPAGLYTTVLPLLLVDPFELSEALEALRGAQRPPALHRVVPSAHALLVSGTPGQLVDCRRIVEALERSAQAREGD